MIKIEKFSFFLLFYSNAFVLQIKFKFYIHEITKKIKNKSEKKLSRRWNVKLFFAVLFNGSGSCKTENETDKRNGNVIIFIL